MKLFYWLLYIRTQIMSKKIRTEIFTGNKDEATQIYNYLIDTIKWNNGAPDSSSLY